MRFLCKKSKDNDVLVITHSSQTAQRAKEKFKEFVLGALALPCKEVKNSIFIFDNNRVVFCGPDVLQKWNKKYSGVIYFDFPEVFYSQRRNHCPAPQLLQDAMMNESVTFPEAEREIGKLLQEG